MKKALIIGEYENAMYHPLTEVEKELRVILEKEVSIEPREDFYNLKFEDLNKYDLLISYTDCWNGERNKALAGVISSYVAMGGALLVIHNGISLQVNHEFATLVGAKFMMHPEAEILRYKNFNLNHPIMKECESFEMHEEPYQFEFDNLVDKDILFYYEYNDRLHEAAWALDYGLGRVVYLSPGHCRESFKNESYRKIIEKSANWLVKEDRN